MHLIYRRAHKVIAWLGLGTAAFDVIFTTADWLHNFVSVKYLRAEAAGKLFLTYFMQQHPDIVLENPFNSLIGKPWFNRLWVIQEATLATQLEICLGFQGMAWGKFATAVACFIADSDIYTTLTVSGDILFNGDLGICPSTSFHGGLSFIRLTSHLRAWIR